MYAGMYLYARRKFAKSNLYCSEKVVGPINYGEKTVIFDKEIAVSYLKFYQK